MKHGNAHRILGRESAERWMLFRNLVTELIKHDRIRTTLPKAKEVKRLADQVVTLGKRGDLHARRQAAAIITEPEVVKKLFSETAARYTTRPGGYTRVLAAGRRFGDNAPMAVLEYVDSPKGNLISPRKERLLALAKQLPFFDRNAVSAKAAPSASAPKA